MKILDNLKFSKKLSTPFSLKLFPIRSLSPLAVKKTHHLYDTFYKNNGNDIPRLFNLKFTEVNCISAAILGVCGLFASESEDFYDQLQCFRLTHILHTIHTYALYIIEYEQRHTASYFWFKFGIILYCYPNYLHALEIMDRNVVSQLCVISGMLSFITGWIFFIFY